MKTKLLFSMLVFLLFAQTRLQAQCEVYITGNNTPGSLLTATAKGGTLVSLEWNLNGKPLPTDGALQFGKTVAGGNGEGDAANQLYEPNGVFADKKGNLWVADTRNERIQKFAPGSDVGITIGAKLPNAPASPTNVFVTADGSVYVADYSASRIKVLAKNAHQWVDVAGANNEMNLTRGVWVDKFGNVYATDEGNNRVLKYAPQSLAGVVVAGGNGAGNALNQLNKPVSVVIDISGNVYVTEEKNRRVTKWLPNATEGIIVAGNNSGSDSLFQKGDKGGVHDPLYGFVSDADDADNNLRAAEKSSVKIYISDKQLNEILLWNEGDTIGTIIAGGHGKGDSANQLNKPFGNFVSGNFLYVADRDNARIQKFALALSATSPLFTTDKTGVYTVTAIFSNGCKAKSNAIQIISSSQLSEASSVIKASQGKVMQKTQ